MRKNTVTAESESESTVLAPAATGETRLFFFPTVGNGVSVAAGRHEEALEQALKLQ